MSDSDLFDLLMSGEQIPQGRYNHATWEVLSNGDLVSTEAQIASVHESMHHLLNNTTFFGLLLIVTAYLARERKEYKAQLGELVNNSRISHEIFATYASLLLVSPDNANKNWVKQRYHISYATYVSSAEHLLDGISAPHLQYIALYSLCCVCFQSQGLVTALLNNTPFDINYDDYPDSRLRTFQEHISPDYWYSINRAYKDSITSDDLITHEFLADNGDEIVEKKYGIAVLDDESSKYRVFVYTMLSKTIMNSGFVSLDNDDHLLYISQLLDYAEKIAPGELSISPLKMETQPESDFGLSEFENETIHIRDKLLPAKLVVFSDIETTQWPYFQFSFEKMKHFYIVSRITETLLKQFYFEEGEKDYLLTHYPDFVVSILSKQKIDEQVIMFVMVLDKPEQIMQLSKQDYFILSNSSLLLFADKQWAKWHKVLQKYSTHTALFDLSPSVQIDRIAKQYDVLEYAKFYLEKDGNEYPFICLFARGTLPTAVFFIPCSGMFANILVNFIALKPYVKNYNEEDKNNEGLTRLVRYGISHLLDESVFNFQALNSQYALRGFAEKHFSKEIE